MLPWRWYPWALAVPGPDGTIFWSYWVVDYGYSRGQNQKVWYLKLSKWNPRLAPAETIQSETRRNKHKMNSVIKALPNIWKSQRGITGLETAIVLIAFVVVSSVFAFAALSTGMFSSDKARETITAGLAQTRSTMELKGSVIGTAAATGAAGTIATIEFHVTQSAGGAVVDLTPGTTVIKYTDAVQNKLFGSTVGINVKGIGGADDDNLLERNEVYRVQLIGLETLDAGDDNLTTSLGVNTTFTLEVIPVKGAVLHIERTTPIFMDTINFLN